MSTNRDFDRIASDWLAQGPAQLNDRVLDAALDEVHVTHQRRRPAVPWRTPTMSMPLRLAAGIAVVAVLVGSFYFLAPRGGIGGPSPSPDPVCKTAEGYNTSCANIPASAPPLPALDATFASPSHGFQVRYPSGWTVTPGTGSWPLGTSRDPGNPVSDAIVTPSGTDRVRFSGASIALPSGMTMDEFRAFASPFSSPFVVDPCSPLAPLPVPVVINYQASPGSSPQPAEAVVGINGCHALAELGGYIYAMEVIAGGRGYTFTLDGHISTADALAWIATITLDPASATTGTAAPSPSASN